VNLKQTIPMMYNLVWMIRSYQVVKKKVDDILMA